MRRRAGVEFVHHDGVTRCLVLVAAIATAFAGGCSGGGQAAETTLPEITLFTTTTTTTGELFSELDSSPGPNGVSTSIETPATSATASTIAPTVQSAAETVPTSTTTDGTVEPPADPEPPPFELEVDGLGTASFGADPDGIIGFISSFIGGPTDDTGYVDPFEFGSCPGTQARRVSWGSLMLEFGDVSTVAQDRLHFYAYRYGSDDGGALERGSPSGLATPEGISVGSSVAALVDAYPDTTFLEGDEFIAPTFLVNDNLSGSLTGLSDTDTVTMIQGGLSCEG